MPTTGIAYETTTALSYDDAIERCRESGKCAVIHVDVDPVKHMWAPSLRDFKDMHQEPKG